jgi:hypothetical protein
VVWFTVQLEDKPGALARMADALGKKGINITSIVGIAEDTGGALMLTTGDPAGTRAAFKTLKLDFVEHNPDADFTMDEMGMATGMRGSSKGAKGRS